MKIYIATLLLLLASCTSKSPHQNNTENKVINEEIVTKSFQKILDTEKLKGSILIFNSNSKKYYSNDFDWTKKENLPASTFKIPNSIIALETKIVANDTTLLKWNGEKRSKKMWEKDMTLRDAFHASCVPCYQEIARKIGVDRMTDYLNKLEFGKMQFNQDNIDMFWLVGDSKISQVQQIDFLRRFYSNKLPITERTASIMKKIMFIEENEDYKISGKSGWSITGDHNNGWFVGYVETQGNSYFFATNIVPADSFDMKNFPKVRKEVTYEALRAMNIIN